MKPRLFWVLAALAPAACNSGSRDQPPQVRGPFIGKVTTSSLVVAWSTSFSGLGAVEYGLDPSYGSLAFEGTPSSAHAVSITGLEPGTTYFYRVSTSGLEFASGRTFTTAPSPEEPVFRFVAFGDCGAGTPEQLEVAEQVRRAEPDLAILTGDIVYESGEPENFDPLYFTPYADLIDHIPFYTSLGNHDVITLNGEPYLQAFHLPHNNPQGTERYYSFDFGNAHFTALDTNQDASPGSPMGEWLQADLAATADWKFVFFHHAPFSSGPHGSEPSILALRAQLEPVLAAGGVDIVFAGHDHDYERTFPIQNGAPVNQDQEPDYLNPAGVIYIVTGGGGRQLYPFTTTNAFTAFFASVHHLVRVEITDRSLALTAVRSDGLEVDSMTLSKS